MTRPTFRTWFSLAATFLFILGAAVPAMAAVTPTPAGFTQPRNLGTLTAGPYKVDLLVQPYSVVVGGAVNLVVRPLTAGGAPVTNAAVNVVGIDPTGARRWSSPALPVPADPSTYVANADVYSLDIDRAGNWAMEISVQGPAGKGTVQFPLAVGIGLNGTDHMLEGFYAFLMAAMLAVVGALIWRARRRRSPDGPDQSHQEPATQ